ncbi:hypothetical protein PWT90_00388 [Aphanocladium album]|nr:hypothetical protein PWT90_00388 [Aphanocladium album]
MSNDPLEEGMRLWSLVQPFAEENRTSPEYQKFLKPRPLSSGAKYLIQVSEPTEGPEFERLKKFLLINPCLVAKESTVPELFRAYGRGFLAPCISPKNRDYGKRCIEVAAFLDVCTICLAVDLPLEYPFEDLPLHAAFNIMRNENQQNILHQIIAQTKTRIVIDVLVKDKLIGIPPPSYQQAFANMGLCLADWSKKPQAPDGITTLLGELEELDRRTGHTLRKPAATPENFEMLRDYFKEFDNATAYAVLEHLAKSGDIQLLYWTNTNMDETTTVYGKHTFDSSSEALEFVQKPRSPPTARVDFLMAHRELMTSEVSKIILYDAMRLMTDAFPGGRDLPRADTLILAGAVLEFCSLLPQPNRQSVEHLLRAIEEENLSDISKAYWTYVQQQRVGLPGIAKRFHEEVGGPAHIEGFDIGGEEIQIKSQTEEQEERREEVFEKLPKPLRDAFNTRLLENVNAVLATMTRPEGEAALELIKECGTIQVLAQMGNDEQGRANLRKIEEQIAREQDNSPD